MESPARSPQQISTRVLGIWEKLVAKAVRAELGRASYNHDGSNSGQTSEMVPQSLDQQDEIDAILQAADEIGHESVQVACILVEHAWRLAQQLDAKTEGRGVLQFKTGVKSIIKQKQQAKQGEVDRSRDIRVIQDYYKRYRERNQIDQLEARMRKQGLSTDLVPDSQNQSSENVRTILEVSTILNDVVDALSKEAESKDAFGFQSTDEESVEEERVMEEDAARDNGFGFEYKKSFKSSPTDLERKQRPGSSGSFNQISTLVLGNWEKLVAGLVAKAVLTERGRASHIHAGRGRGSSSGQRGEMTQEAYIDAVLQAADKIGNENAQVARILTEHAWRLAQQLDPRSEGRGVLQFKIGLKCIFKQNQQANQGVFDLQQSKRKRKWDRSQDLRVIQYYYKRYRERNQIDQLEARMRKKDGPPTSFQKVLSLSRPRQDHGFDHLRRTFETSSILNDVVNALLEGAEPEDTSSLQDNDEERVMEEDSAKFKGFSFYKKWFRSSTPNWQSEQHQNTSTLRMFAKKLLWIEFKYSASVGELDYFVENVIKELREDPSILNNPEEFRTTQVWWALSGWGDVDARVPEVVQKIGTTLHWAVELEDTQMVSDIVAAKIIDVNAVNWMKCTALHMAVLRGNINIVRELLTCEDRIRLTEEDEGGRTPVEIAHIMGHTDIEIVFMEYEAVSRYVEALYRDRQVYVDAANAILVGAALIASVTFASWLQPPLGYTDGHVDVRHNEGLRAFWVFNTLSFYFAIGTVVFGARIVLPGRNIFIKQTVEKLRINLLVTSILLACSVFFGIIAYLV